MQTLLMGTGERNFSLALRLDEGVMKSVMKVWRMLTAAGVRGAEITLPVALKWSSEEPSGHFEMRKTLGRVVPNPRELAADLKGGTLVVSASGARVVWHRGGGGVVRGAAEVPVAAWAELEAQWWEVRVLVAGLRNAGGSSDALPDSVMLRLTDALRTRVRAAANGLGEFGPGSVTLDGEDVGLLACAPQDITRRLGATAVGKSGGRLAMTVHGSQLDDETNVMPWHSAVVVTAAALYVKVTAPGGEALVSPEVALWRLGYGVRMRT